VAPDTAKIKSKMLYASTKDSLKKKLVGIGAEIQATDKSELEEAVILERLTRV
jgi:cofilin